MALWEAEAREHLLPALSRTCCSLEVGGSCRPLVHLEQPTLHVQFGPFQQQWWGGGAGGVGRALPPRGQPKDQESERGPGALSSPHQRDAAGVRQQLFLLWVFPRSALRGKELESTTVAEI